MSQDYKNIKIGFLFVSNPPKDEKNPDKTFEEQRHGYGAKRALEKKGVDLVEINYYTSANSKNLADYVKKMVKQHNLNGLFIPGNSFESEEKDKMIDAMLEVARETKIPLMGVGIKPDILNKNGY